MTQLTYDECDTLLEAVDKWENESDIGEVVMETLFESMIDDPDAEAEMEKMKQERKHEKQIKMRERKRKAAKLKAKIYEIQDEAIKAENGIEA